MKNSTVSERLPNLAVSMFVPGWDTLTCRSYFPNFLAFRYQTPSSDPVTVTIELLDQIQDPSSGKLIKRSQVDFAVISSSSKFEWISGLIGGARPKARPISLEIGNADLRPVSRLVASLSGVPSQLKTIWFLNICTLQASWRAYEQPHLSGPI